MLFYFALFNTYDMANKLVKWVGGTLVVALVIAQFISPKVNNGAAEPGSDDITVAYNVQAEVTTILKRACYDCHSGHTNYPWYSNVQPVGWWLANHIDDGKRKLNFSEFKKYTTKRKLHKLKEVVEQVTKGEMPLESYLWIHDEAKLTEHDKKLLIDWAKGMTQRITMEEGMVAK